MSRDCTPQSHRVAVVGLVACHAVKARSYTANVRWERWLEQFGCASAVQCAEVRLLALCIWTGINECKQNEQQRREQQHGNQN
jgi:hypothetical protein